jgi:hypothetical protein
MATLSTLRSSGAISSNERSQLTKYCSQDQTLFSIENHMAPPCVLDQPLFSVSHISADLHTYHTPINEATRTYMGQGREKPMTDGPEVWHCSNCGDGPYGTWQVSCQNCGHAKCGACKVEET